MSGNTKGKVAVLVLALVLTLLGGCMNLGVAPVIRGIIATNEFGLYTVGLTAFVDDSNALLVWDTGDGKKERGNDQTHVYEFEGEYGEYTVTLTATSPHGMSSTETLEIVVRRNVVSSLAYPGSKFEWWNEPAQTQEDALL